MSLVSVPDGAFLSSFARSQRLRRPGNLRRVTSLLVPILGLVGVVVAAIPAYASGRRRQLAILREEAELLKALDGDPRAKALVHSTLMHSLAAYRRRVLGHDKLAKRRRALNRSLPVILAAYLAVVVLLANAPTIADWLGTTDAAVRIVAAALLVLALLLVTFFEIRYLAPQIAELRKRGRPSVPGRPARSKTSSGERGSQT